MDNSTKKLIKEFAKKHNMSYVEMKKKYMITKDYKSIEKDLKKNIKLLDKNIKDEKKKSSKKSRKTVRKKKKINSNNMSKEDTTIYDEVLEKMKIKNKYYYVPIINGVLTEGRFLYELLDSEVVTCKFMKRVGKVIDGQILFF